MKACAQERLASVVEARLMWLVAVPVVCIGGWWCAYEIVRLVLGL